MQDNIWRQFDSNNRKTWPDQNGDYLVYLKQGQFRCIIATYTKTKNTISNNPWSSRPTDMQQPNLLDLITHRYNLPPAPSQ